MSTQLLLLKPTESYKCYHCEEELDAADVNNHGCLQGDREDEEETVDETVEYLDSEDETASSSGEKWSPENTQLLIRLYISKLREKSSEADKWKCIKRDLNAALKSQNRSLTIAEIKERIAEVKKIHRIALAKKEEGFRVTWPLMDLVTFLVDTEKKAKWSEETTKSLIRIYKSQLRQHETELEFWQNVVYHLSKVANTRFTSKEVAERIEELKSEYEQVMKGRKKEGSNRQWPYVRAVKSLLNAENEETEDPEDMEEWMFSEAEEESQDDDETYSGVSGSVCWTAKETAQLAKAYKKHVLELIVATSLKAKGVVWEKIASEVEFSGRRQCNPYIARCKIGNLKRTFERQQKGHGRPDWPYYNTMMDLMRSEEKARCAATGISPPPSPPPRSQPRRSASSFNEPPWFKSYRLAAKRRHEEKMELKMQVLNVLETFLSQMS